MTGFPGSTEGAGRRAGGRRRPAAAEAAAAASAASAALAAAALELAEDRRLATLHLRLGDLALARAELEDLRRRGELDPAGATDLAEARWRSGDLDGAAVAAADHLAAGGTRPIARVIAAEAAAAAGQPVEARAHVAALGAPDAAALEAIFAGMPRRAFWPSALGSAEAVPGGGSAAAAPPRRRSAAWSTARTAPPAGAAGAPGAAPGAEPADELALARDELATGHVADAARGIARLALVLRLDPTLAPAVLSALGHRRDAAGLTVEGDACRILGRHLEAEAAFAAARRALRSLAPESSS